ncbi:MAG: lactonase family protein, partial [Bacteroidales bacterium]|nr:lactonase family protein [Bacteroidales bacterium]
GSIGPLTPIAAENGSFVIKDTDGTLYAVSENDPISGVYSFENEKQSSFASDTDYCPCFLYKWNDYIFTADYGRGSISIFPVEDKKVQEKMSTIQYHGSGPYVEKQSQSRIHQVRQLPEGICNSLGIKGEWLLASDLGDDSIHVLEIGGENVLTDNEDRIIKLEGGTGPRHMEFSVENNLLYCISEFGGRVYVLSISQKDGKPSFELVQTIQADQADGRGSADIHMHPSGKFLYTSHRLVNDGICIFDVNENGLLSYKGYKNTGIHPRNFQITEDGQYMLVACRDSYDIEVFSINAETGALSEKPVSLLKFEEDQPVCIVL